MTLKLLDGFCCQGGASMGYHQVGFVPYGIDINPQPHYPFPFHQGDVIQVLAALNAGGAIDFTHKGGTVEWLTLDQFVAAHKSPPCQAKSKAQKIMSRKHPRLIAPTRELLIESGLPYVIENVVPENEEEDEDPLIDPIELCGAMFGLGTYRHRLFESNMPITAPDHPEHTARNTKMGRPPVDGEFMHVVGNFSGVAQAKKAMGISWMTRDGLRESIPPAYTHHIGRQLMAQLVGVAA